MRLVQKLSLATLALTVLATPLLAQVSSGKSGANPDAVIGKDRSEGRVPNTYGTSTLATYTINAYDFNVFDSSETFSGTGGTGDRYLTNFGFFLAPVHIPSGASITFIEVQGCNTAGSGTIVATLYSNTTSGGVESETGHGSVVVAAGSGCGFFAASFATPPTVDNVNRSYYAQVTNGTTDGTTRFSAVRLYHVLQVSPAPGTATFTDVPTSHPQFRFVEALVAAGITGGCGGGNYCPDSPLTRGQMAVFLSAALGLQWQ